MSRNKTTPAEKRHKSPPPAPEGPPKRTRSQKDRPGCVEQLEYAIRSDRLDLRTREAQQLIAVRDAVAADPAAVATGAIRDILAVNIVISASVARQLSLPGVKLVDEYGAVHPLVGKHLELQKMTINAAQTLLRLESAAPGKAKADAQDPDSDQPVDVSSIVLELTESSNK